ncbi:type I polyketide synthase [Actinoalloteichus sp. AHMU CJ021]|uniref:SDR family oxidoreductase n=1 Tax=Actinoalloteichus TaxID=65496 RepID=UPI0005545A83|nr:SDR family oxidoreductase [Actinoalloteichus caeruleus]AUS80082.1 type I polyketide synthase [Actinoalloteichus sp. AHMU CJ021]
MTVAITGATGFLGIHLVRELLAEHDELIVLVRSSGPTALRRLMRFYAELGTTPAEVRDLRTRLRLVPVDLTAPGLGLRPPAFRALADEIDALWHSAGDTDLGGGLADLRRTNLDGTRGVLALALAGERRPRVYHVSTAFVAGRRRHGTVEEDDLDDSHGFENFYEQSKFEAEVLVRRWATEHARPVAVLRPSVLVTDRAFRGPRPGHPVGILLRRMADTVRQHQEPSTGRGSARTEVRVVGDHEARLNFLPVEEAARMMVRLAASGTTGLVDTYHVVARDDVSVLLLTGLVERFLPLRIRLVSELPAPLSALEFATSLQPALAGYLLHHRRLDASRTWSRLGGTAGTSEPSPPRIDLDYLSAAMRRPPLLGASD